MQEINTATDAVKARIKALPEIALVLGSGLGALADVIMDPVLIPTHEIPFWPVSTVPGHKGMLVFGNLDGKEVMVLQGRTHYYEGHNISKLGLPVRVMQKLGVKIIILTNAAGGINIDFNAGDVMVIKDHFSLMPFGGENPLRGPNLDEFGPRFPDMSRVYDEELIALATKVANQESIDLKQGVYVCLAGPSFETPADCRFLRAAGVDAVGMSTVPEAIVARHGGTRVLAFSGISNKIDKDGNNIASHEEVLEAGKVLVPKIMTLVHGVLRAL